ncbi:MAG TPA: GDSL-type esterase/lipase family protein [Acidimicrobiales bacterium]|nr:GDSL-type esterase/lipase family protein [Acidimicrobiales bacterium]
MALCGTLSLLLGVSFVTVSLLLGSSTPPAFADTAPYELYCPSTPVGNIVLNDVVTTGTLSPANPSARPFSVAGFQVQLTLPPSVVSALQAQGATSITGTYGSQLLPGGSTQGEPATAGPLAFDVAIPSPVPTSGLPVDIPSSPTTVNGFFATPETIGPDQPVPPSDVSVALGPPTLTVSLPSGPFTVTCANYANDAIATSGITTQAPVGTPFAPTISQSTPGPPNIGPGPYYLALGDSVPMWNGVSSYPYDIASNYAAGDPDLEVMDLACSGETTSSMLNGPGCAPTPFTSQMQEALSFLQQHQGSVALITIDIGGNDVVSCVSSSGIDQQCVTNAVSTMTSNLQSILSQLRQAAGPSVPIVGMNYFDPFLGDWLAGGAAQSAAIQTVSELSTFNGVLSQIYSQFNVPVADVFDAFETSDLTDIVSSEWGVVPVAVDNACMWLDIGCSAGQIEGFGDDPVDAGATVIANAFDQVIGPSIGPTPTTTSSTTSSTSTTSSSTTSTSTTSTSTTSTSTTSASTTLASSTTTSTTAGTVPGTTSSTVAPATKSTGTPPVTSAAVQAPSSALAFTGPSTGIRIMGLVGVGAVIVGVAMLVLVDAPRRLLWRLSRSGSRRGAR